MRRLGKLLAICLAAMVAAASGTASAQDVARSVVTAGEPTDLSVTIYRDPDRAEDEAINANYPQGFAMISESRRVTLPPGRSTIRFIGVAEGMVAVSAIVTGLPGGTIEKNRNADLLSPAALVDGTLGNRVTITRTNPGTGVPTSETATVRTRADGGLVLQTSQGFEAVRCAGLPEKLTFDSLPDGLEPQPVFTLDTQDASGGTYEVTLTYIASGFDWQANYVATLLPAGRDLMTRTLDITGWLTLANENGQSFADSQLLVIAGTLNIESDFEDLADAPNAAPLRLTCYPIGSTATGSPIPRPYDDGDFRGMVDRVPAPMAMSEPISVEIAEADAMIVTASRVMNKAEEEELGDLKLYRVPERVTVASKGQKQVAFLTKPKVEMNLVYRIGCGIYDDDEESQTADMLFRGENKKEQGLGDSLPMGQMTVFEGSRRGPMLLAEPSLRDYARGEEVELELGESPQVNGDCMLNAKSRDIDLFKGEWTDWTVEVRNANGHAVAVEVALGGAAGWDYRLRQGKRVDRFGQAYLAIEIPANESKTLTFRRRYTLSNE